MEKESKEFLKDVKVIPWELLHRLVVVDVQKKNLFRHKKNEMEHAIEGMKNKKKREKEKI